MAGTTVLTVVHPQNKLHLAFLQQAAEKLDNPHVQCQSDTASGDNPRQYDNILEVHGELKGDDHYTDEVVGE